MKSTTLFDILYIVDLKHRDLPTAKRIGHHLTLQKFKVGLCNGAITFAQINNIKPRALIIPKANWNPSVVAQCIINSIKIIVIETEGNPQDKFFKANVLVAPDLHIFWNNEQQNLYKYSPITKKIVVGNPRTDLLIESLSLQDKVGSNSNDCKFITIATASQDSHYSPQRLKNKANRRKRSVNTTTEYVDILEDMRFQRDLVADFLKLYAKSSFNHRIYLKPHPHEAYLYWQTLINDINDSRIRIMLGQPIETLLSLSKFHISFAACSTAAEALLMQLPVLQLRAPNSTKNYQNAHLDACHFQSSCTSEIFQSIDSVLDQDHNIIYRTDSYPTSVVDKYISRYFHVADGNRAIAYSNSINSFMQSTYFDQNHQFFRLLRYLTSFALIAALYIRNLRFLFLFRDSKHKNDAKIYADSLFDHHIEDIFEWK